MVENKHLALVSWELEDGEARHREAPATFWIPPEARRESLRPGDIVKLIFRIGVKDNVTGAEHIEVERMWVSVTGREGRDYMGLLDNDPYCTDDLKSGEPVLFSSRHVIQIYGASES